MLSNYIKVAFRNLIKTKLFSAINILGLSIGIAACLLILHYVNFERSYDKFHHQSDRIYRLRYQRTSEDGSSVKFASSTPPAGLIIRERLPEIEKIARIFRYRGVVVSYKNIKFTEERVFHAEPEFLDIFDFKFTKGDPKSALGGVDQALISQSMAKKYFGDHDPMGKVISVDKKTDYQITGIFKDVPQNSHIKFDMLLSFENFAKSSGPDYMENWGHTGMYTYLILKNGTDISVFNDKIKEIVESEVGEMLKEYNMIMELPLQPLENIHLDSHYMQEYEVNGNREVINFLVIIALFIIIIAWVNYINLSTARSLTRAKEVGLRKTVGGSRQQIMIQFFFETLILNMISLFSALILIYIALPFFSQLTGVPIEYSIWHQSWFWLVLPILFVTGIIISGLYPIIKLSAYQPVTTLRGKIGTSSRGVNLRKVLVAFQYLMAFTMITGTLAVFSQIEYMKSQELGFDHEQTLVIKTPRVRDETFGDKIVTFKEAIQTNTNVEKFCVVTEVPGRQLYWDNGGIMKAGEDISKSKNYMIVGIDYDFADLFNIEFVAGRNFSKEYRTDTDGLIFNETAVRWMGFESSDQAVGQKVDYWGKIYTIVGVLKDYHQQSLKEAFEPIIYRLMPQGRHNLAQFAIKLKTGNIQRMLQTIEKQYAAFFPGNPMDYFFLDEYFDQQYKSDEQFGHVFGLFALLAIFVTSLGILGLVAFMVTQRTKEIGIRKVLGAGVPRILYILAVDILKLIVFSFVILLPFIYWGIAQWLQSFAYRMNVSFELFFWPLIFVVIVTLVTIGSHVIRAAMGNPVESLRYE